MGCAGENTIVAYLEERLGASEVEALFRHLDGCAACAQLLFETAGALPTSRQLDPTVEDRRPSRRADVPAARGPDMGRYRLTGVVGSGGMGVVYSGWDPQLDRKVALKLLRSDHQAEAQRARLVREAQAMARLSHPNVITIYEVGTVGEQLFLAMELIEGTTLAGWLRARRRPWREVLATFLAAGRGLDAAHRAGLVHRDFKPDNVLVSVDGRVCVTDFGLARLGGESAPAPPGSSPLSDRMTRTGALVGTPAYMAPEQLRGKSVDARTDVFSYCVALYEGLYGVRPFGGATVEERMAEIEAGRLQPPRDRRAPAWLQKIVVRGLRAAPGDRPPSLAALLDDLARAPARRWRRRAAATLAVAVAAGVLAWPRQRPELCRGAERRLAGVWDPARRAELERALAAPGRPYLVAIGAAVTRALDARAADWAARHRDACEATRVRGEQSEDLLDRRMSCLDSRLHEVGALVDVLAHGDEETLRNAAQAVSALQPLSRCDAAAVGGDPRPPGDAASLQRLAAISADSARSLALWAAGRFPDSLAAAEQAVTAARALGFAPALAEALQRKGDALYRLASYDDAAVVLEEGAAIALGAGLDRAAATAYLRLADGAGEQQHWRVVRRWLPFAEAALRHGGGGEDLEAWRLTVLATMADGEGAYADAEADFERALPLLEKVHGPASVAVLDAMINQGAMLTHARRYDEARRILERALERARAAFGPDHPAIANALGALAVTEGARGNHDGQDELSRQALAVDEKVYGPTHVRTGLALYNIASALNQRHRYAEAVPLLERALPIFLATFDDAHVLVNVTRTALGGAYLELGRIDEAVTMLQAAVRHPTPYVGLARFRLARALWSHRERAAAVAAAKAAQAELGADPTLADDRREVVAWIASHR